MSLLVLHLCSFNVSSTGNNERKEIPELTSPFYLEWKNKMHYLICFFYSFPNPKFNNLQH